MFILYMEEGEREKKSEKRIKIKKWMNEKSILSFLKRLGVSTEQVRLKSVMKWIQVYFS